MMSVFKEEREGSRQSCEQGVAMVSDTVLLKKDARSGLV